MTGETETPRDDDEIRSLVARLARPHRSGGRVVERAGLAAAGADLEAVLAWIEEHGGVPEEQPTRASHGLHGARDGGARPPARFVLPPAAFD